MRGIEYLVDDRGRKKAVVIDLKKWGKLWEDMYDAMIYEARKDEPTVPWEVLKAEMEEADKSG
jgi:hypothetical protein